MSIRIEVTITVFDSLHDREGAPIEAWGYPHTVGVNVDSAMRKWEPEDIVTTKRRGSRGKPIGRDLRRQVEEFVQGFADSGEPVDRLEFGTLRTLDVLVKRVEIRPDAV